MIANTRVLSKYLSINSIKESLLQLGHRRNFQSTALLTSTSTSPPDTRDASPPSGHSKNIPPPRSSRPQSCPAGGSGQLLDVAGKVAIISGGCTGICLATAVELLQQNAKHVVLTGREPADGADALKFLRQELPGELNSSYEFLPLDVTNTQQFEDVFRRTLHKHHRVDILFNVAAMMDDSRWEYEVDTNINGLVRGILFAFRYMGHRSTGLPPLHALTRAPDPAAGVPVVVNMACVVGLDPLAGAPVYSLTQSAAVALTRCFGARFHSERSGVRVVCLYSGITSEDALLDDDEHLRLRLLDWEWSPAAQEQLKRMPVQEVRESARAAVFLARFGPSGSVWLVENSQLAQLRFPRHGDMAQRMTSFK